MNRSLSITALILLITVAFCCVASAQRRPPASYETTTVTLFESHGEPAIQAVLRFGMASRIPLGLILADDSLCRAQIDLRVVNQSAAKALDALVSRLTGYVWTVRDGFVIVQPRELPQASLSVLNMVIPRFAAPEGPLKEQQLYLWMDIRAILRPEEGTLLNLVTSPREPKAAAIELRNASVEQILARLVSRAPIGAWVLFPVSEDLKRAAAHQLAILIQYGEDTKNIRTVTCRPPNY